MLDNYSQLLIDVQKKANIVVSNISDIKFLKEEIEIETTNNIGFNTLRRLFGFLEKTKPSIKTLNTLAAYIGFNSFYKYQNHQLNYDEWYFQQNLRRIQLLKKITVDDVISINFGLLNDTNIVYLAYFLSFQIQENNLQILDFIFKNVNFKPITGTNFHKFSTIISSTLLSVSEKKALFIYEKLMVYDVFKNNVPLLYIDYTNLNGRYGKILNIVKKTSNNPSDLFFLELMRAYSNFYIEVNELSILDIKKPKEFETFHVVLRGRFYGYCILKSKKLDSDLTKEILKICKSVRVDKFLQEIVPALIIKEEFAFLEELIYLYYEDLFESDRWDHVTSTAIYLIALANVNFINNNIKSAISSLELVELDKVELSYENYVSLFYYLIKLKVSLLENNKVKNKHCFEMIKKIVKITGFKKFISEAKKYSIK
ncbi:hypothetical protein [Polaribacter gangjinensis]|uniref:Uncharacterized protein n=1 Tax=Polaribacter gangjinensis TaxID=574710 RepID=A0A2S7WAY7_9FLAO|nr:hypothetical protein [Polaribacter gangjinensis]PQJ74763.1 hypothetical protein BTO13_05625 [Polaribacter gangjinensis]